MSDNLFIENENESDSYGDDMPSRKRSKKNITLNEYDTDSEVDDEINSGDKEITPPNTDNLMTKEEFNAENEIEDMDDGKDDASETEEGIEAFNMDEEMAAGQFDKQGNYISTQSNNKGDLDSEVWIDEVGDVQKVAEAHKTQIISMRKRDRHISKARRKYMLDEALVRLFYCVDNEESILETLARFNALRKKASDEIVVSTISNAIDLLTDIIDILEKKDIEDIYDLTSPKIKELVEEESLSRNPIDDPKGKNWSFKWITGSQKIYEYYSDYEMKYWKDTYFNNNVIVKYKDDEDNPKNWLHVSCLSFK